MAVILVTGSNGQLGSEIKKLATNFKDFNFLFTDVNELDITSVNDVNAFFPANHPDVVINCAAYTAVDKAESEPEQAHLINAVAVKNLAESCKKYNAFLVHTSTDYVFDGKKDSPYLETDRINPQSAYGRSKAEGEEYVLQIAPKSIIVRTSWLYSSVGNNFVKTIIRVAREKGKLNVVNDQFGSPTYAADMAKSILDIIASGKILPQVVFLLVK